MAELKTLLVLTQEVIDKDNTVIALLETALSNLVDAAMTAELDYEITYDADPTLSALPLLQKQRVTNRIKSIATKKGYRFSIDLDNIITLTWTIATLP